MEERHVPHLLFTMDKLNTQLEWSYPVRKLIYLDLDTSRPAVESTHSTILEEKLPVKSAEGGLEEQVQV